MIKILICTVLLSQMAALCVANCDKCTVDLAEFNSVFAQYQRSTKNNPNEINGRVGAYKNYLTSQGACSGDQTIIANAQKAGDDVATQSQQTNGGANITIDRIKAIIEYILPLTTKCEGVCVPFRQFIKSSIRGISELSNCQQTAHNEISSLLKELTGGAPANSRKSVTDSINEGSVTLQMTSICIGSDYEECKSKAFRQIQRQISKIFKAIAKC